MMAVHQPLSRIDLTNAKISFDHIDFMVSEANREGVEGEPQATLGGRLGSPRTGQWCRHCGSIANPSSDCCVPCWSLSLSSVMEVAGQITEEFKEILETDEFKQAMEKMETTVDALFGAYVAPLSQRSPDPATP